ncbi:MAG: hydroxymethylbilane synthase [Deltaproteobacteria bacterium]|nr:hydroxymethylbilane synthase [Deltaproteobacteria bacterium]
MSGQPFRLGTRKSRLATTQSEAIRKALEQAGLSIDVVTMEARGDVDKKTPLYEIEFESPGLFTKQLENALFDDRIDLAVHSLKDLPTSQPPGLQISCIPRREIADDCLVIHPDFHERGGSPLELKAGTVVGTSSLRREALLISTQPNVNVVPLRGNIPTRLKTVKEKKVGAVMLARAGLLRLGADLERCVLVPLPAAQFVPAPAQGALAVQTRVNIPQPLNNALKQLHDPIAEIETTAERQVLRELEGGCSLPLGVRVQADMAAKVFRLFAFLGTYEMPPSEMRRWLSFERFDISESNVETLVRKTVAHFKGFL